MIARLAFDQGGADYLLLVAERNGNVGPVVLEKGEDPGVVRVDVPYQLANLLSDIYPHLGTAKIAVVSRRCDERAIAELSKRGILDDSRIVRIGLACSEQQIQECRCSDPVPSRVDVGEAAKAVPSDPVSTRLAEMSSEDRLEFWIRQFRKCNKCYGCTINCPVCFCDDCVLEERTYTPERGIPPGLAFHLIRSFHVADKCVECGECERSCPAEIPLLALRKMVSRDMRDLFGFTSGGAEGTSPLLTTLDEQPLEDDGDVC